MRAASLAEFRCQAGITPVIAVTGLEQSESMDLIRELNSTDSTIVSQTRTELIQRGFTEFHLKFARRLFDPDPAVPQGAWHQCCQPARHGWHPGCFTFARMTIADVRLTAVSLIVTTGNPAFSERAEAIARADSDPGCRIRPSRSPNSVDKSAAGVKIR